MRKTLVATQLKRRKKFYRIGSWDETEKRRQIVDAKKFKQSLNEEEKRILKAARH